MDRAAAAGAFLALELIAELHRLLRSAWPYADTPPFLHPVKAVPSTVSDKIPSLHVGIGGAAGDTVRSVRTLP